MQRRDLVRASRRRARERTRGPTVIDHHRIDDAVLFHECALVRRRRRRSLATTSCALESGNTAWIGTQRSPSRPSMPRTGPNGFGRASPSAPCSRSRRRGARRSRATRTHGRSELAPRAPFGHDVQREGMVLQEGGAGARDLDGFLDAAEHRPCPRRDVARVFTPSISRLTLAECSTLVRSMPNPSETRRVRAISTCAAAIAGHAREAEREEAWRCAAGAAAGATSRRP